MSADTTPWHPTKAEVNRLTLLAIDLALIKAWAAGNEPLDALPLHIQALAR